MQTQGRKAIIIGGGIGGVTAAVALRRAGFDVVVYEQAEELREIGAGITIWPNAMKALQQLGLDEAVWAQGQPFGVGRIFDWGGKLLVEGAKGEIIAQRFGWPGVVMHRSRLLAALSAPLPPEVLRLGRRCAGFTQDAAGVTMHLTNGETDRGDLLIAADGLNSLIRAQLFGSRKPAFAGYAAYRGIVPFQLKDDVAYESWGFGQRFGFVPGTHGDIYWWAALNVAEGQHPPPSAYKQELRQRYRGWFEPVEAVIEATPEQAILRNDIYDRPPTRRWTAGRVALLGDAAHPVTPDLGQGGGLAVEDAAVLGRCLSETSDIAAGLKAYEAARRPRAAFLRRHSRWMARLAQLQNPLLCRLRNAVIRWVPARLSLVWLSWQFQFDG